MSFYLYITTLIGMVVNYVFEVEYANFVVEHCTN